MLYKNLSIDNALGPTIRHMDVVNEHRETLQGLQAVWDNLSLLGQISGVGADMSSTRQAFHELTGTLINQLGTEIVKKVALEMSAKAQVAIDILVRNLYERTADIGFLATDDDICQYLREQASQRNRFQTREAQHEASRPLRARFAEYVTKYSVYHDIVLLDTQGKVLVRLDESLNIEHCQSELVADALAANGGYIEHFGQLDLLPGQSRALVYAASVRGSDGEALGVLCLCFRFDNEMQGIFANLVAPDDWSMAVLLDTNGCVLASSDHIAIPLGARMQAVLDDDYRIVRFGSAEYLATSRSTQGYQGYMGPGWIGHVMIPLQHAFNAPDSQALASAEADVRTAVSRSPSLFGESLRAIPRQAERIQNDLNRSVWNGSVRQGASKSSETSTFPRALLREISSTGRRTQQAFETSIANLYETVVSARLHDSSFLARLAVDIMDRNLYERANDCRWWALTSAFRELLAAPAMPEDGAERMSSILAYINSLYTVYDNLLVFDMQGRIVASSRPLSQDLGTRPLTAEWVRRTLALDNSQGYVVSDFAPTPLYDGRPTYIYAAAIRAPDNCRTVGGVAIVFDAAPQFAAILHDTLPRNVTGKPEDGSIALFVEEGGKVIACSDARHAPGSTFHLATDAVSQQTGARILRLGDTWYAAGFSTAAGYREYKGPDDAYRNPLTALLCLPLCEVSGEQAQPSAPALKLNNDSALAGHTQEVATFRVGHKWFGLQPSQVVEAVETHGITPVPGAGSDLVGYLMFRATVVPVFDLRRIVDAGQSTLGNAPQAIILQREAGHYLGILADALGGVAEVAASRLQAVPEILGGACVIGDAFVTSNDIAHEELLLILSAERIFKRLSPATAGLGLRSAAKVRDASQAA